MKILLIYLLIFFCISEIVNSQDDSSKKHYSITISAGTAFNAPVNYYFFRETEDKLLNPGLYGSLGIEYGPFNLVEKTQLFLSVSISHTKVATSEFALEYYPSNAKLTIETFPILFWGKIQTDTKLSPFIEFGIGYSRLNFIEKYSNNNLNGTSFNYWALGYGFGAGITYQFSENFHLELVAQSLLNEKDKIVENDRDHKSGIAVRNNVIPIFLRINIKL